MKKLSIEQKAKAYDEAKLRMSAAYNSNRCTIGFMNEIFPELAESEDEKIRKEIVSYIKNSTCQVDRDIYKSWLAWLEKQGELKPILDVEIPFGAKDSELEKVSYSIPNGYHAEIEDNKVVIKKGEQKSVEWSEEDEMIYQHCLTILHDYGYEKWLKSLKDRSIPQPKQEWSEEDEDMLNLLKDILNIADADLNKKLNGTPILIAEAEFNKLRLGIAHCLSWLDLRLKSLRPQKQWKPSEEQMVALKHASNDCSIAFANTKILATLYEQLKALHRYGQDT